jgi:hypothetical protein
MSITFTCSFCNRSFTVDDRLAGKRGKCKWCGSLMRIPESVAAATSGLCIEDLHGLEDAPAVPAERKRATARRPVEDSTPVPSRARAYETAEPRRKKTNSDEGPWGVAIRRAGCWCIVASLIVSRLLRLVPAEYKTNQLLVVCTFTAIGAAGVGVLITLISVVGAAVSFITGNRRAFASESTGEMAGWVVACLLSVGAVVAFGYGFTHPSSNMAQTGPSGGGPPAEFPSVPPPPVAPSGADPSTDPGPGAVTTVRRDVRVNLSNGRFMRNTSPLGMAQPGVEISVDYKIEAGQPAGGESFVLVIKSSRGRGELDNLNELRFQRSGTIHASSFMATPAEGPYEAWVELASMPGRLGRRRQVSNTISLQFTDVQVRDPAAEARAAMEEQRRKMMNRPSIPQRGRGFGPPGRMGPRNTPF